jgi:hypothetical protein
MKILSYLLLSITFLTSCNSGDNIESGIVEFQGNLFDSIETTNVQIHEYTGDQELAMYLDSLNDAIQSNVVPEFIYDPYFDFKHPYLSTRGDFSIRRELIFSIQSIDYLEKIVALDSAHLLETLPHDLDSSALYRSLPFREFSTMQLVMEAKDELGE